MPQVLGMRVWNISYQTQFSLVRARSEMKSLVTLKGRSFAQTCKRVSHLPRPLHCISYPDHWYIDM